ncbi:PspC domain-containing protein [uncultured Intestinimonas sp.]|uniref:PspC domain-containing protein n=1 Tax=Intestinimonas sp. HCP28S3_D6 TaxID=3438942 RepID=UPI0025F29F48|nr:PspC domain-containing protein [uncultured Intestinimonas sp.]
MDEPKKLYRTEHGAAMLCGVCGGIAEYFNIDPSIVRLLWAALVIMGGTGILLYIIAAIVLPRKSQVYPGY